MSKDWNKNRLIGSNAENIIEFLINSMPEWKCLKFGVENHIKDIKELTKKFINPVTIKIKKMPDFVVFNEKTGETFFIEVKYISSLKNKGYFFNYLEEYNEYWRGTKLIIVHIEEPHFIYVDLEKVNDSMKKSIKVDGNWKYSWNFKEIEKDIKDLFPYLKDEDIKVAIKRLIPKKINNST